MDSELAKLKVFLTEERQRTSIELSGIKFGENTKPSELNRSYILHGSLNCLDNIIHYIKSRDEEIRNYFTAEAKKELEYFPADDVRRMRKYLKNNIEE